MKDSASSPLDTQMLCRVCCPSYACDGHGRQTSAAPCPAPPDGQILFREPYGVLQSFSAVLEPTQQELGYTVRCAAFRMSVGRSPHYPASRTSLGASMLGSA
jgi:hypothetical protein